MSCPADRRRVSAGRGITGALVDRARTDAMAQNTAKEARSHHRSSDEHRARPSGVLSSRRIGGDSAQAGLWRTLSRASSPYGRLSYLRASARSPSFAHTGCRAPAAPQSSCPAQTYRRLLRSARRARPDGRASYPRTWHCARGNRALGTPPKSKNNIFVFGPTDLSVCDAKAIRN